MKSNWEVLKEKVINDDKDGVSKWIRGLRRYPHTPVLDYLEMDSEWDKKDYARGISGIMSVKDLKAIFDEWKGV